MVSSVPAFYVILCFFGSIVKYANGRGPVFLHEPPPTLHFSNSTGVILPCSAHGDPKPSVSWLNSAKNPVEEVTGLSRIHENGSLQLLPFPPSAYTASIHAAVYMCRAASAEGIIVSRPVKVRAVVRQYYEVQVYDEFVISGNTAVLKCHVPSFVRDYVTVTSWLRGSGEKINANANSGGRYSIFPSGELHIRHVTKGDEFQSYQCVTKHILSGETATSSVAGRLMVNDPRSSVPPRITDSKSTIRSAVGDSVELPCAAQGYPIPQYKWYHLQGNKKQSDQTRQVHESNRIRLVEGSLLINQLKGTDAGRYVCVVSSSVGEERTHTTLEVWAPLSAHISPQIQTVDVGGSSSFNCSAEGFPLERVTWLKDGKEIDFNQRVYLTSTRTIFVSSVIREDRGMYQCMVSNSKDSAQGSAQLKLGDASPQWYNTSSQQVVSPGAQVTLECIVQGSPAPEIRWSLRGGPVEREDPRAIMQVNVERDTVIGRLVIPSVSVEDGGIWGCSAKNRAGMVHNTERLNVRGPPAIRPMGARSVVAGQQATFNCIVVGYPIDSIYWEKNGVVLPVSHRQTVHNNGTLTVRKVSREADSGQYSCVATAGKSTVRAHLVVTVMVPPEVDRRLFTWGGGHPLGSAARIMCVATKGDLPLRFQWYHNSRLIEPTDSLSIKHLDDQTSILLFNSVMESDGGNYTCSASNEVARDSFSAFLLVKVAPSWHKAPRDISVIVGSDVTLPCHALGSPVPNITWKLSQGAVPRKYMPITSLGPNVRIVKENLLIQGIQRDQGGEIICIASNGVGSDLSKSVKLTVKVPPQFATKMQNVTVTSGERATFSCFAFGNLPISVIWSKGNPPQRMSSAELEAASITNTIINDSIPKNGKNVFNPFSKLSKGNLEEKFEKYGEGFLSTIQISTGSRHDSLMYSCLASNMYGNDTKMIRLIVQEIPGPPSEPKVSNTGSRSINLTWESPSHNGNSEILMYRVLVINSTDSWLNIGRIRAIETTSTTFTVGGLRPAHSYLLRVLAINAVGSSVTSREIRVSTVHEPPTVSPSGVRVIPLSSSSLKVTWKVDDTATSLLATYGYYIGYKLDNSSQPFRYSTIEPSNAEVYNPETVLSNLRKYSSYVITVQAFNEAGAGPRSIPVVTRTDEDVPSESPKNVQCSGMSSTSLILKWNPPDEKAINGLLQGYKVLYRPITDLFMHFEDDFKTKRVMTLSTPLMGLIPYTNYSLSLSAYTRMGDGVTSEEITCTTDQDIPGPPSKVKAVSVDVSSILLSWLPPNKPNGIIIKYIISMMTHQPHSLWLSDDSLHYPSSHSVVDSSLLESFHNRPAEMIEMMPGLRANGIDGTRTWIVSGEKTSHLVGSLNKRSSYTFRVRAATLVGEGSISESVTQKPRHDAPAQIASFTDDVIAIWGEDLELPCMVVGKPSPSRHWMFNGNDIGRYADRYQEFPDGTLLLREVRASDAGNYSCSVSNAYGRDMIYYKVSVRASKGRGAPPSSPAVFAADVYSHSILVGWKISQQQVLPLLGYYIHIKREFGGWVQQEVSGGSVDSYLVSDLECGTEYQIYVTAFNQMGPSQPSDAITTRTVGREPIIPLRSEFLQERDSSLSLKLASWRDGGCPVTSFVIEYKKDNSNTWRLVSNYARWNNRTDYVVRGLIPDTSYLLKVTAHNSAGSTVATYPFSTLRDIPNNLSNGQRLQGSRWIQEASVVVAVIAGVILLAITASAAIIISRKKAMTENIHECKVFSDMSHLGSPPLNGAAVVRRQSMDILEAYIPCHSPPRSPHGDSSYSSFKLNCPPPPPVPSPHFAEDDDSLWQLKRNSYDEDDIKYEQSNYQYDC